MLLHFIIGHSLFDIGYSDTSLVWPMVFGQWTQVARVPLAGLDLTPLASLASHFQGFRGVVGRLFSIALIVFCSIFSVLK